MNPTVTDRNGACATSKATYLATIGDPERDRSEVIAVWEGILGPAGLLPEKFDNFYLNCPYGRPVLQILRHQPHGDAVGVVAAGPRRMLWKGSEIQAGVFAHLAVLPAHRKVKPAVSMQRALIESCRGRFQLLYGLPSVMGASMGRLIGQKPLGQLVRYVKVLRYRQYLERLLPRPFAVAAGGLLDLATQIPAAWFDFRARTHAHVEWSAVTDVRMQDLWDRSPHGQQLTAIRDVQMLRWRFDQAPAAKTRFLLVSDGAEQPLSAWFSCEIDKQAPTMLTVTDFWSADGGAAMDRRHVQALCRQARVDGFHAVEVLFTSTACTETGWLAAGFSERGRKPVFGGWLDPAFIDDDLRGNLHLTYLDQDG